MRMHLAIILACISLIAPVAAAGSIRASSKQHSITESQQFQLERDDDDNPRHLLEGTSLIISEEVLKPDVDADDEPDDRPTGLVYDEDFGGQQPVQLNVDSLPPVLVGDELGASTVKLNLEPDGTLFTYEKLASNGFGNPTNRFIWSGAFDPDTGDYCCATFNINWDYKRQPSFFAQVLLSPDIPLSIIDATARALAGSPINYSEGGEVWCKKTDEDQWTLAYAMPSQHTGFRNMVFYAGQFYGASSNGPDGPEEGEPYIVRDLYRFEGGPGLFRGDVEAGTWERVDDRGHINGYDRSVRAMVVSSYSNRLFMGTETNTDVLTTARVISYDARDNKWRSYYCGYLDSTITQATELERGLLLFGALNGVPGSGDFSLGGEIRLYLLNEITESISTVSSDLVPKLDEDSGQRFVGGTDVISELRVFNGQLFVSSLDVFNGFKFYRTWNPTDPAKWDFQRISINGFQEEQKEQLGVNAVTNHYVWNAAVVGGTYYIGTNAGDGFAQIWKTTDGEDWEIVVSDGFGDSGGIGMIGFRTLEACPDSSCLFVGGATDMSTPTLSRAPYEPGDDVDYLSGGDEFSFIEVPNTQVALAEALLDQLSVPGNLFSPGGEN